jgi:uncharacterized RDD family membrane protein YckC
MKCPKCGYLGFEATDRCKNCGYDFSLTPDEPSTPSLRIRASEPIGPLPDLRLFADGEPRAPRVRGLAAGESPSPRRLAADLPLFGGPGGPLDDLRLPAPTPPRPPLSVRRSTPGLPKSRPRIERPPVAEPELALEPARVEAVLVPRDEPHDPAAAGAVRRVAAACVDLLLMGAIDLVVVYLTLRLCRMALGDVAQLPWIPMLGFFLLLNGGYLIVFTAALGQTIGKMLAGIRVVSVSSREIDVGRAALRTSAYLASALPFGLGFAPALVGASRRTLHDHLAATRVITIASPSQESL